MATGNVRGALLITAIVLSLISGLLSAPAMAANILIFVNNPFSYLVPGGYINITVQVTGTAGANTMLPVLLDNGTFLGYIVTNSLGTGTGNFTIPDYVHHGQHTIVVVLLNGTTVSSIGVETITINPPPVPVRYNLQLGAPGYASVNETVGFIAVFTENITGTPVDPDTTDCTLYLPNSTTDTLLLNRISAGLYNGSFTPRIPGTYSIVCNFTKNGLSYYRVASVHVSDKLNIIISNMTAYYTDLLQQLQLRSALIIDEVKKSEANLSDLINQSTARIITEIKGSELNITALINNNTAYIIAEVSSKVSQSESNISGAISNSTSTLKDKMNKMEYNLTQLLYQAINRIIVVDSKVDNLNILIRDKYNNLTTFISANATKIIDAVKQSESNVTSTLTSEIATKTAWIIDNVSKCNDTLYTLITTKSGNIIAAVNGRISQAESNVTNHLLSIEAQVAFVADLVNKTNDTLYLLIVNKTGEIISYINSSVVVRFANLTNLENNITSKIDQQTQIILSNLQSVKNNLQAVIISESGDIQGLINDVGTDVIADLTQLINNKTVEIKGHVSLQAQILAQFIASANSSLHTVITDNADAILAAINTVGNNLSEANQSLHLLIQSRVDDVLDVLQAYYGNLYALVSTSNITILTRIDDLQDYLDGLLRQVKQNLEGNLTTRIELSRDHIILEIGNSTDEVLAAVASANQSLHGLIVDGTNTILGTLASRSDALESLIFNTTRSVEANLTLLIGESTGEVLASINMSNATISSLILTAEGDIIAEVRSGKLTILTRLGGLEDNLTALIGNSTQQLSQAVEDAVISLQFTVNNTVETAKGDIIGVVRDTGDNVISTLSQQLGDAALKLNANITKAYLRLNTSLGQLSGELSSVNATLSGLIINSTGDVIAVVTAANETILVNIGRVQDNINSLRDLMNQKFAENLNNLNNLEKNLKDAIQQSTEEVKSVASNYGVSSTTASVITLLAVSGLAIFMRRT
ncbi:MAG: hypothetical protein F7C35_06125 [Desulfurococcales archaeon]|nr:hypothetical protein [Desulfurococcales archaeon]